MQAHNFITDGCRLEDKRGNQWHVDFVDDVLPDRTCGQYERGIYVVDETDNGTEYFISFDSGSVWRMPENIETDLRCPEAAVLVALADAREPHYFELEV